MPIVDTSLYRQRDEIVAEMIAQLLAEIPDAYTGEDGVTTIIFQVQAGQLENLYLAHQLLLEDMFIQTASYQALLLHGDQYGLSPNVGTKAAGSLQFEGEDGVYIPIGSEVGYDPGGGLDVIYFLTTTDDTIPAPGDPGAPTTAIYASAGNLNGTYEYVVTFVTASGETLPSPASVARSPVNQQIDLSAIPLGGTGTTARRIYRDKNGAGTYRMVTEIANNTATTYRDNITDAVVAGNALAPTADTAHKVTVDGEAEEPGLDGNVAAGGITELSSAPSGLIGVVNTTDFTGGSEEEDTEDFRQRLLAFVQNPQTGSPDDLKAWAEEVNGVDSATVFSNTPGAGQATVRIAGPNGSVPSADVITAVDDALQAQDIANISITVAAFTAVSTNVTADVTVDSTFTLSDVQQAVIDAVTDYINSLAVGGTLYVSGLVDAVFGLPGILDVVITTPATNQTTAADSKRTPGTISVV